MEHSCREVAELMPWVVNATASVGEQCMVYRHIAACGDCRTEFARSVALQRHLNQAVQALPAAEARPSRSATQWADWLAPLVEALGGPRIAAQTVRLAVELPRTRPELAVNIPLVATVRVGS